MKSTDSTGLGKKAEEIAFTFLKEKGLKPLERNYHTHRGEIDLIMQDKDITVFIEVRARSSNSFLEAIETIDQKKQSNIIYASEHYLQARRRTNKDICRFDVVTLTGKPGAEKIHWIKEAFDA